MPTVSQLKEIAHIGGGFILHASDYTISDLKDIATICKNSNSYLILLDTDRITVSQLKEIAHAGSGNIILNIEKK